MRAFQLEEAWFFNLIKHECFFFDNEPATEACAEKADENDKHEPLEQFSVERQKTR